jgi:hypothetical protein
MKTALTGLAMGALLALGAGSHAGAQTFQNCREARSAGFSDIERGQPGYGAHLDRDGDGFACESGTDNGSGVIVSDDDLPMTGGAQGMTAVVGAALMAGGVSWAVSARSRRRPA